MNDGGNEAAVVLYKVDDPVRTIDELPYVFVRKFRDNTTREGN